VAGLSDIFRAVPGARPRLACEIRHEGVIAGCAAAGKRGAQGTVLSFAPLNAGALTAGLKTPNLADRAAVVAALESALNATSARDKDATVVIPDAAARVLLLDFDTLPARRQEALPVVRFRLRKMVPFDAETAAVSYQVMAQKEAHMSVLVTAMPGDVLEEYEGAVREAGYEPGAVLPSTLAAAAGLSGERPSLMVNHTHGSVTTAVTHGSEMLLHRTMDLPADENAREEEMAQAVITTLAWYEDTLRATPERVHYAGRGGVEEAQRSRWLRYIDPAPPLEDMPPPAGASFLTNVPAGTTAGVTGALTNA
jgi:type IV pilus assembly protein PilM